MQHLFTPLKEKAQAGCLPARIHRRTKMRLLQTALLTAIMTFCLNMSFAQTYYQVYHSGDGSAVVVNGVTVGYSTSGSVGWGSQCGDMQTRPYCIVGNSGSSWTYTFSPAISSVRLHMVMVASGLIGGSEVAHVLINGTPYTVTNGNISGSTSPNSCGDATVLTTSGGAIINGSTGSIPTGVITINPGTPITSFTINNSGSTASSGFWNFGLFLDGPAPPENITGTPTLCTGSTTTLSDATSGGTWSSSNTSIATVNSTGVVTGVTSGTATISYTNAGGSATQIVTVNAAPGAFSGEFNICLASTFTLSNAVTGGTWASSNTGRVTIGSSSGVATSTGVSLGTVNISYTVNGCLATRILTVSAAGGVTGIGPVCPGGTLSLTSSIPGGVWSVQYPSIGTISSTGLFTGVSAGTTRISYMCGATGYVPPVTVNPIPDAITGTAAVCQGFTTSLSSTTTGGSWSSSATGIATVNSSGVVTGMAAGTAVISYIVGGCSTTLLVTVNSLPTVSAITGNTTLSTAITTALTSSTTGGVWTSSNSTVGTINSSTGVVTGLTSGTSTISYTVTSSGCSTTVTTNVTVKTPNSGLSFDGANDYISAPAILSSNQSFTKEAWIYLTNSGLDNNIISSGDNAFWVPGGQLRAGLGFASSPAYAIDPAPFTFNQWVHVATTFDAASHTLKLYKNGALVATNTSAFTYNSGTITIGAYSTLSNLLQGKMDEVRIWNVARTQAQIQADMNCDAAQNANLLAYYRFDNGTAGGTNTGNNYTPDYSGNNNCGTLNNFALTGTSSNYVTGAVGNCNTITLSLPAITGTATVCPGAVTTLSDVTGGGTWSSSTPAIGTVNTGGVVSGLTAGTTTISYSVCGVVTTRIVTVNPLPTVSAITGNTTLSTAITTKLSDATTGGAWISGNTSAATVNSSSGLVAGVAAGTSTISYTVTSLGCSTTVTTNVTVNTPLAGLSLDGTNDHIALPASLTSTCSNFTFETWMYVSSSSVWARIMDFGNNTDVYMFLTPFSNGGTPRFAITTSDNPGQQQLNAPSPVSLNTWTHIAVTIDGSANTGKMYINGALVATNSSMTLNPSLLGALANNWLGKSQYGADPYLNGRLDEVRIWNTTRTASEIADNMNCNVAQNANLLAYYRFDNGVAGGTNTSNASAIDYSANGACGTMNNMSLTGTSSNYVTGAVGNCNTISPVSPGSFAGNAPVCVNSTITLSNSTSGGTWSTASSNVSVNASTGVVTGITAGTGLVSYTRNCISASVIVTVNALPTLNAGSNVAICNGASTTRTVTGAATYVWSPATRLDATSGASVTASPTVTTTYTITGTNSLGCVNTTTTTVSVNPLPAISGTPVVCQGGTTALSGSISGGTWTSGAPSVATIDTPGVVTGAIAGNTTITYTLPTGCYGTQVVNVNANPSASINITGSSVFCDGNSAILTPAITGSTPFLNAPGANGATTVCDCPTGYVAVGLSGGAGTWMDRFFIHCRQLVGGVLTGGTVTTSSNGASGGGSFQGPYIFSGNKVMVGASAVASWANTFHSITGYGQDVSYIAAGGNNSASPTALTTIAGASGVSTIGSVFAPAGMVITGMYTYDNWFVTGVAFRYKPISAFSTTSTAVSPYIWSTGDTTTSITVNTSGSYSVSYTATNGCSSTASQSISVNPLPADITGVSAICANASTTLENTTTGGVWTSNNTTVATIESTTGVVNALSEGTTTITYTLPTGCVKTMTFVVNPVPAITGTHSVCEASATALSATISGGTWASSNDSVAAIGTTGIVSGLTPGFAVITYTLPTGCSALQEMVVNPLPHAGSITGDSVVAAGSSIALSSSVEGGTWSASNSIATVSSTGVVTGVGAGAVVITYSYTNLCGTDITTKTVNVVPGVGSGSTSICVGANTTLSGLPVGGTWSSNNVTKATVNASGMVVGVSAGTVNISYTVSGITTVTVITVNTTPTNITGSLSICNGGATTLSSSPAGGTWSVAGDTVATIGTTGILSGLAIGTANVSYTLSNGCAKSAIATVNAVPSAIGGTTSICVSGTTTLTNDVTGGIYSSSNSSVATTSLSGVVTGVAAGTSTISYSIGGCRVTTVISVISAPAITGTASMCIGNSTTLSNATTGGTWTSSNSSIATVNASSGFVMGAAAGTATITYTLPTGCTRTQVVTVNSSAIAAGPPMICIGAAINYSSSPATTSWTSSTPSVATVNSSGLVTGVSSGTTTLYMVTAAGCNSSTVIAVNPQPTITGTLSMCLNGTTSLTGSASGVTTWTSSSSGTASVGYLTGVVTGMNVGTSTISYTVGVGQGCLRTAVVTVNALPTITGTPTMCVGNSVALAGSPAGGSWSSATPAIGTVSTTGMVTGITAGTVDIIYTNATTGCAKTKVATINATPGAFIGTTTFCVGTSSTLTNPVAGGTWSSSNASIASAGLTTGVITGVAAGTALISYRIGTCQASSVVTIKSLPNNITGGMQTVVGATTTLSNSTTGGTWSSSNPTAGTISSTGVVTGIAAGTSNIVYTGSNGCTKSTIVTINAAPALPGPRSVCVGSTINISSPTVSVSSWSSSDTAKATVSGGIITGVAPGTSTITYVLTAGGYSTTEVTVLALPAAITGSLGACVGATTTLSNATTGGAWLTSNSGLATIDTNGVVTGVGAGPVTITYSLGTGCRRTVNVTVSTAPAAITGSADVCTGTTMYPYLASPSSGTWSSSDITVATVPSTHGAVTGVAVGTALISLTNAAGCSTTKVVNVSVCRMLPSTTAVSNLNDNLNITLYPNPTRGTFSVSTPEAGTLSVSTIDGREVMKRDVNAGITELKLPSTITTGVYMCRFYGNDGASKTVRLVFEAE